MTKKRVLAISGSNHVENGITRNIIELLKSNLERRNDNIEFLLVDSTQLKINVCNGCNNCFVSGKCSLDHFDDMEKVKKLLEDVDLVIFGSPVYLLHVSSPMKILLDRLSYWCHLLKLRGKMFVSVVTSSRSGIEITNDYLKYIALSMGMIPISEITFEHSEEIDNLINKINKSAYIIDSYLKEEKKLESNDILEQIFLSEKREKENKLNSEFEIQYWAENELMECSSFNEVLEMEKKKKNYEKD